MATLDDKILGEKLHYYCSSSEDEGEEEDDDRGAGSSSAATQRQSAPTFIPERDLREWDGYSCNTGPKGVIKDWQRYKQLENEKREGQEAEKLALMKKLSISCKSHADEEKEKNKEKEIDEEVEQLLRGSDPFFDEYMKKRMLEQMGSSQRDAKLAKQVFGSLIELTSGAEFLEAIDHEKPNVTVVCHIYCQDTAGCAAMNGCLRCLAAEFDFVKFCSIEASCAGMSKHFEKSGVPALLVYKKGVLLGNFVRLTDEFGEDFYADDVQNFLVEHGFLPDNSCVPEIVSKSIRTNLSHDDDSDLE